MKKDTENALDDICNFLDIDNFKLDRFQNHKYFNKYESMNPEIRDELIELYKPHNDRLFDFLGKEIKVWL